MDNPKRGEVSSSDLSQEKSQLSCFHSGRQENTTSACRIPGLSQNPWSGSSKTLDPMAVAEGPFWRLSSSEDHPLSTCGGQSFKHPLFIFLERKKLFWLSKAQLLCSVGWGCTISSSNLWFIHQDSCSSPCENAWSEELLLPLTISCWSSTWRRTVSSAIAIVTTGWVSRSPLHYHLLYDCSFSFLRQQMPHPLCHTWTLALKISWADTEFLPD